MTDSTVFVVSLIVGAMAWAAFLSYGFDGSFPTWQVVGAVVAVVAAVVFSRILARGEMRWATVVGVTVGFAAPWTWSATRGDDTGLSLVGALFLTVGLLLGTTVLSFVVDAATRRRGGRA